MASGQDERQNESDKLRRGLTSNDDAKTFASDRYDETNPPDDPVIKDSRKPSGAANGQSMTKENTTQDNGLRSGLSKSDQVERHNKDVIKSLVEGDMVEFPRGRFSHWAIYVGEDKVIHLTGVGPEVNSGSTSEPLYFIGGQHYERASVRMDNFHDVAGESMARKNNKLDNTLGFTERNGEEIVKKAEEMIKEEVTNNLVTNDCERFVTYCRYNKKTSEEVERHNKLVIKSLVEGDMVEFPRGWFSHWAIYVGDEKVIHLTRVRLGDILGSFSVTLLSISGLPCVRMDDFHNVALEPMARKNNKLDNTSSFTKRNGEEIVKKAEEMITEEATYNLFTNNSEHFVTLCRYDKKTSEEVERHNKDVIKSLVEGDMVEFPRGRFSHWAIYVGEDKVIHLTGVGPKVSSGRTSKPLYFIGGKHYERASVRMDNFHDVAGESMARKNNKQDNTSGFTKRNGEEIVKKAEEMIKEEVTYNLVTNDCERFVTYCRYDKKTSEEVKRHNEDVIESLVEGDMVEFPRGIYSHWAIYVGEDKVIHLTGVGPEVSSSVSLFSISGQNYERACVRMDDLHNVALESMAKKNNKLDNTSGFTKRNGEEIVEKAEEMITEKAAYNLVTNNCEHFVTLCRYNKKTSGQVLTALNYLRSVVATGALAIAGAVAQLSSRH